MNWRAWEKLRALFQRERLDREFAQELDAHYEALVEDAVARGEPVGEARRQARLKLGHGAPLAEMHREERGVAWLDSLARDLRYGARGLLRSWGLSVAATLSLAFGVGANTGVFSLLDQALFRLLPVARPEELVWLNPQGPAFGNPSGSAFLSHPMFRELEQKSGGFNGMFGRDLLPAHIGFQGETERIWAELVTGGYFSTLGVGAHLGRVIAREDDRVPGGHPVCVLSYSYWQSRYDSDARIVGKTLHVNGHPFTIIGVSAAGYEGLDLHLSPQIRVPVMMKAVMTPGSRALDDRGAPFLQVYGRLMQGVSARQAREALQPLYRGILETESMLPPLAGSTASRIERIRKGRLELQAGSQPRMGDRELVRRTSWVLMVVAAVVLLTACANIANLLLARGVSRHKEIAVRLALGASRGRLVRQLLVESLLLAMVGGLLGLPVAYGVMVGALQFAPAEAMRAIQPALDARVLLFAFVLSLVTGLAFGLLPALRSTRPDVSPALKNQSGSVAGSAWLRKALVSAQVALSLAVLITALLLVSTLRNLRNHDVGFPAKNLITFSVEPKLNGYSRERSWRFRAQLQARLAALPGVESVTYSRRQILGGDYAIEVAHTEGGQALGTGERWTFSDLVDWSYPRTIGLRLVAGRGFERQDQVGTPAAVMVNETFARRFFPGQNAVGRRIGFGEGAAAPLEIVGVLKDATYAWMRSTYEPVVYRPMPETADHSPVTLYVRVAGNPDGLMPAIRRAVRELDAAMPVYQMRTMRRQVDERLGLERIAAAFSSWFGVISTLLALLGLCGVMNYLIAGRTREIGLRMALGAGRRQVLRVVMGEVLAMVAVGVAGGLALALALGKPLRAMLFGLAPNDPVTLGGATLLLVAAAWGAGLIPAWRASCIDPVRALREE